MTDTSADGFAKLAAWSLIFGLCCSVYGAYLMRQDAAARKVTAKWRVVDGIITSSKVIRRPEPGEGAFWLADITAVFGAEIQYRYRMDGVERSGVRLSVGTEWTHRRAQRIVKSLVRRYQPGTRVRVLVNPADPDQSVLEPGDPVARPQAFGYLGGGILFTAIGLALASIFW